MANPQVTLMDITDGEVSGLLNGFEHVIERHSIKKTGKARSQRSQKSASALLKEFHDKKEDMLRSVKGHNMGLVGDVEGSEANIARVLDEIDRIRFRALDLTDRCVNSPIYDFWRDQNRKLEGLGSQAKFDDAEMLAGNIKKMLKDNKYLTIQVDIQKIEGLAELLGKTNTTDKAAKK